MSRAYYNEFEPYSAEWLKNLISAGHIAPGDVDTRSITDVAADDLKGYDQCHFFAGIGVWSHSLRLSGWDDARPAWTGSCPCQPFSVSGKGAGQADPRHLWPVLFRLIEQCRPPVVFGEQVEAAIRHGWLDLVQGDLEGIGYASGAVCIPAGSVGAPHIRQRLWFVAHPNGKQQQQGLQPFSRGPAERLRGNSVPVQLGYADNTGSQEHRQLGELHLRQQNWPHTGGQHLNAGMAGGLGEDSFSLGRRRGSNADQAGNDREIQTQGLGAHGQSRSTSPTDHFWRDADWLLCRDGKWRPVEPGTFPLAHGASARVGRLRAYGNAIVPQVAQEIISAYMDCRPS